MSLDSKGDSLRLFLQVLGLLWAAQWLLWSAPGLLWAAPGLLWAALEGHAPRVLAAPAPAAAATATAGAIAPLNLKNLTNVCTCRATYQNYKRLFIKCLA